MVISNGLLGNWLGGSISEPGVEYFQLLPGRINKYDPHANSIVYVNDLTIRHESLSITGNDHPKESINGKGVRGVHVTSLAADFCHFCHDAYCARGFDEFRD